MRRLFAITQLAIRVHDDSNDVTIEIRLPAAHLPDVAQAAELLDGVDRPGVRLTRAALFV